MKRIFIIALVAVLSACAMAPQYGDFSNKPEPGLVNIVGYESAIMLAKMYPAAKTTFLISEDIYPAGEALERNVRQLGFATSRTEGLPLRYIFDEVKQGDVTFYRMTLNTDRYEISRYYTWNKIKAGSKLQYGTWSIVEIERVGL